MHFGFSHRLGTLFFWNEPCLSLEESFDSQLGLALAGYFVIFIGEERFSQVRPMALFAGKGRTGAEAGADEGGMIIFVQCSNGVTGDSTRRPMGEAEFHFFPFYFRFDSERRSFRLPQTLLALTHDLPNIIAYLTFLSTILYFLFGWAKIWLI